MCIQALPRGDYEFREMHPVHDLGLSEHYVRDIESKHGTQRWVVKPKNAEEDLQWKLQKRIAWNGPCGGAMAGDGAFFVSLTKNRLFQIRCRYITVANGSPVAAGGVSGTSTQGAASIMDCIDRCAEDVNFNKLVAQAPWNNDPEKSGCRYAELRLQGGNAECRIFSSFSAGTSAALNTASSNFVLASYIGTASCSNFDTVATPLYTPCGFVPAGSTTLASANAAGFSWTQSSNYATRTPTATAAEVCQAFPLNNVCGAVSISSSLAAATSS